MSSRCPPRSSWSPPLTLIRLPYPVSSVIPAAPSFLVTQRMDDPIRAFLDDPICFPRLLQAISCIDGFRLLTAPAGPGPRAPTPGTLPLAGRRLALPPALDNYRRYPDQRDRAGGGTAA